MAGIFLEAGQTGYKVVNTGDEVFGSTGTETVAIDSSANSIEVDANAEQVNFAGAITDYKFAQAGNVLKVYSGSTLVAEVVTDGSSLVSFHGATAVAVAISSGVMSIDGNAITSTPALLSKDTATAAAADLITEDGNNTLPLNATATTITGSVSDLNTIISAAGVITASDVAFTVTDADEAAMTAADLKAIGAATTGAVTVTNATAITGAIADVTAATVTAASKVILDDATITISDADAATMTAADLKAIGAATTGDVTVTNAVAIIGSASDVTAATVTPESKVILDDATITISDETTKAVFDDIDAATTGTITATITTGDDDTDVSVVYTQVNVLTITNFEAGATDTININALTNGGDILGTDFTTYDGTKTAEDDHIVNLAQDSAIAKADDVVALFEGNGGTSDSKMLLDTDDTTFLVVQDNDASAGDDFDAQLWLVDNDDGTIAATLIGTVYDANDSESLAFNDFA